MKRKYYNEFNEVEKQAIDRLVSAYFRIDMCDSPRYFSAISDKHDLLYTFNEKFGYNFIRFKPDYNGNEDAIYFEIPLTEEEERAKKAAEDEECRRRYEAKMRELCGDDVEITYLKIKIS